MNNIFIKGITIMKKVLTIALTAALMSPFASAAQNDLNAWTKCGIGAMVFEHNDTAAAISNVIWDLGTTAVSSKLSSVENCNGKGAKTAMYIKQSFNNIIEETAQGEGQHLTAMLDMYDVAEQQRSATIAALRAQSAEMVSSDDYVNASSSDKAQAYYTALVTTAK